MSHPLLPVAVFVQRLLVDIPCKVDASEFKRVPARGPLIAVANHIGALEVPMMLSYLHPRPITGMAKIEAWRNPIFNILYTIYRAVPVRRGEADTSALKGCMDMLSQGAIMAVSPEGTRSHSGKLQQGHAGVVLLAVKSGAPIIPFGHYGGENIWKNLRRLRRTPVKLRVGDPFSIDLHGERLNKDLSQRIADEIMYQIAALLPPFYRGLYSDMNQATTQYLRFEPGCTSSLARVAESDSLPTAYDTPAA
jgi:1-acyl-sn-glycerol-3-phosphate acyltransferase